jgi:hypothetical protein
VPLLRRVFGEQFEVPPGQPGGSGASRIGSPDGDATGPAASAQGQAEFAAEIVSRPPQVEPKGRINTLF